MQFLTKRLFERSYAKLSNKIREKFIERKNLFQQDPTNPILNIHKLSGEYEGMWSINVTGNYRAIFDKREDGLIIFININTHPELFG